MKIRDNFIHLYKHVASIFCAKMKDSNSQQNEIKLKCKRCQKIWKYTGSNPYYATCTFCKTSVNVIKNRVQIDNQANSSQPEHTCEGDLT